jgi:hypothetical protein
LIVVDDVPHQGVKTQDDERFSAAAFSIPEGRLNVGLEHLKPTGPRIEIEEIRIVRSTDLDQIKWGRYNRLSHLKP